jgi:periplasmic protein TonB
VARADQGIAPASLQRLGLALAASLLAHAALLQGLAVLPGAWQPAAGFSASDPAAGLLRVMLLPGAPEAQPAAPAKLAAPAAAVPRAPRYLAAHELDRRPQILSHVEPHFPALALVPTGRVVLRLYIDETGGVDAVAAESADRTGEFEAAAREAFAAARFLPGIKDGVPVKALVRLEVLFGSPHPENVSR